MGGIFQGMNDTPWEVLILVQGVVSSHHGSFLRAGSDCTIIGNHFDLPHIFSVCSPLKEYANNHEEGVLALKVVAQQQRERERESDRER